MRRSLTAVVVVVLVAGASVAGWHFLKRNKGSTVTTPSVKVAPLTGLPDPSGVARHRPALTVKIENVPAAFPQQGIDHADVVYEEIVEGGITRLAAIFNSTAPSIIGPVRSVRRTDHSIVWPIGGIFAFSGGAAYAITSIDTAPVHIVDEVAAGAAMYRDLNGRVPPDNLYGIGPKLFALGGTPIPPPALFTYRTPTAPLRGPRVSSFIVGFGSGYTVSYNWNTTTQSWGRIQFGSPDLTADGAQISPKNVIVQDVNYLGGVGQVGAEAQMVGSGVATVFVGGHEVVGTWHRGSLGDRTTFRDAKGRLIRLTPGQTWVELLNVGDPLTVTLATGH